jgi:Xaa-Pro aminopeptidase
VIRLLALGLLLLLQEKQQLPTLGADEYASRRAKLMEKFSDGVVVIDTGRLPPGASGNDAYVSAFDFTYLAGLNDEEGVLVLVPGEKKTFLFVGGDVKAAKEKTGLDHVLERDKFDGFAKEVLSGAPVIYTKVRKATRDSIVAGAPDAKISGRDEGSKVASALSEMRMVKTDGEIVMMKKAADATNKAHLAAMKACKPGMNEKDLQKVIEDTFTAEGCDGLGFPSIIGSGPNGTVLHYMTNNQEIPKDSLVVCDIGASYRGYVTDITRTLPTSGKYTDAQREAYQCVLDAQKAAEKLLKEGVTFAQLDAAARKVFEDRELTRWSYAHSRTMSVRHGLCHYVGLAVHDSGVRGALRAGSVITIEPGYYSKNDGWGIRIEDIYLVKKDGFERLSAGAPREVDEIEKLMQR